MAEISGDRDATQVRENQAEYFLRYLDTMHAERVLGTEQARVQFLTKLDPQKAADIFDQINGIVQGLPLSTGLDKNVFFQPEPQYDTNYRVGLLNERGPFGLGTVGNGYRNAYIAPSPEERKSLMIDCIKEIKKIDNLEDQAYASGLLINLVHGYYAGNGRTSRIIASIIRDGYDGSEDAKTRLRNLFSADYNKRGVFTDTNVIADLGYFMYMSEKYGYEHGLVYSDMLFDREKISDETDKLMDHFEDEWTHLDESLMFGLTDTLTTKAALPIVFGFLQSKGKVQYINQEFETNGRPFIDIDGYIKQASSSDVTELIEFAKKFRADYVRWVTVVYVYPADHLLIDTGDGEELIKDTFTRKLKSYEVKQPSLKA